VKTLTDKIAELEGTQQPQPCSINETPPVAVAPTVLLLVLELNLQQVINNQPHLKEN